jgi:hypothetical protein
MLSTTIKIYIQNFGMDIHGGFRKKREAGTKMKLSEIKL